MRQAVGRFRPQLVGNDGCWTVVIHADRSGDRLILDALAFAQELLEEAEATDGDRSLLGPQLPVARRDAIRCVYHPSNASGKTQGVCCVATLGIASFAGIGHFDGKAGMGALLAATQVQFSVSEFVPLAVGFFGLGTGYLIYGPGGTVQAPVTQPCS